MKKYLFIVLFFCFEAGAIVHLGTSFFLRRVTSDNAGSSSTAEERVIGARLGYEFPSGLYLGGTSHNEQVNATSSISGFGVGLGYFKNQFFIIGNYILSADFGNYSGGSGIVIDLGYLVSLGTHFSLGPQILYRNLSYDKLNGASADFSHSLLTPALALDVKF